VALPSNHPLANCSSLKAEELAKEHILLLDHGHFFRDQVIKAIPNIKQYHNTTVTSDEDSEGNSLETLCTMVATGLGISLLPQSVTKAPNFVDAKLTAVPLHGENAKRRVVLAWRASFPRHQAIDVVRNAICFSHNISPNSRAIPELACD
jgi:LysR family hydrogen peroxide-inducible transcriptional activator